MAQNAHPVLRVAVDGVDGSGKTTFADELGRALTAYGCPVIRASVDGFHNPRALRYQRGRQSPEGFFLDSYDYAGLVDALLRPLAPGGDLRFRRAIFDHRTDSTVEARVEPPSIKHETGNVQEFRPMAEIIVVRVKGAHLSPFVHLRARGPAVLGHA